MANRNADVPLYRLNARIPSRLKDRIENYLKKSGNYKDLSEFTRAALKEKIELEDPSREYEIIA